MSLKHRCISILCLALVLGACTTSASASPSAAASPVTVGTLTPTAIVASASPAPSTAASSASPSGGGGQATPSSIDPCSLLTQDEASTLMGKKLGAGVSTTADQLRVCTFKSGLTEVKLFVAPPAPDAKTAQDTWDAERAQVPANLPVNDVKNLFDRAAYGAGSAGGISLSALFVIKGTTFFDLYCGFPGCTEPASVTAATLIGGRLP